MAYTVVGGDTLGKIAKAKNTTVAELMRLNPQIKDANVISIGWELTLPDEEEETKAATDKEKTDYTDDAKTRFTGLPGKPEIWKKGNTWYAVYFIPGTEPPVPIIYQIPTFDDVESFFDQKTPVADRIVTDADIKATGGMVMGSTDNIPEEDGDPWAGFLERMDRAAETQPWLSDPEVFAIHASAWLEGREVQQWELEGTTFWQKNNKRERDWMWTVMRDPEEAARRMEARQFLVAETLAELGLVLDSRIVDYIADQVEMGHWDEAKGLRQIAAIAGGSNSSYDLDVGLVAFMDETGTEAPTSTFGTQNVIDLYTEWLGPAMGQVSEADAAKWATKIREHGDVAREELVAHLKQSRLALFPTYTDESMSYAEIAAPWKNFATRIWGQSVDESSPMFLEILAANDAGEAGKILRREGLKEDVSQVTQDMATDALGPQGSLRRAAV